MEPVGERFVHWIGDLAALAVACVAQACVAVYLVRTRPRQKRTLVWGVLAASFAVMMFGFALRSGRVASLASPLLPGDSGAWVRAALFAWTVLSIGWAAAFAVERILAARGRRAKLAEANDPGPTRRGFLAAARGAMFAAPATALGFGIIERGAIGLREHDIPVPGLPPDLHGLRIVQITDIHMSPFFSRRELDRAVAMANETRAHIALVTGDLITSRRDPLDDCLRGLKPLRADAGVFGCMGNHEKFTGLQDYTEQAGARQGLRFLRDASLVLPFGSSLLNLAGVDYQPMRGPYLPGAERMIVPGAYNVLLSHNPDVFDVAARQGYDLTISGHTHGGQVRVEILGADLNVARFFTPYVDGLYRQDRASIFVSRGLGTIGIPARLGAPPEVTLLRLCRT